MKITKKEWLDSTFKNNESEECIYFEGYINAHGYGRLYVKGKVISASRYILSLKLGRPIKDKFYACHTCDNRACVNKKHLYEGTHQDNMIGMWTRKRHPGNRKFTPGNPGSKNGRAKINEEQVVNIRTGFAAGESIKQLSEKYNMYFSTVSKIVYRQTWRHIE